MIGSLPLTEGIIAIAVGGGLGLLLCCLIIVCIVRNRKFSDDDDGEGGRGKSGGADHRTSAIELKQQQSLSKGYSSQNLNNSFTGGQTASSTDRASLDDSFPSYSTSGGSGPPQRALTQGYMPTDSFARSSDFSASTIIERSALQLRGEIGRGGYGVVYKGDLRGLLVAVKCIGEGLSAKDRQDFEQEAKLLQSLPPHENVVRLIGVAYEGQSPMIVLEYLAGGSLIDLLESSIKIGRPQIVDWLRGVSAGMVHLRNHNIIHRDLAARNVMLGARGEPKVTDFGMSRFVENTADAQHVTASSVGPLKWMSPQSLARQGVEREVGRVGVWRADVRGDCARGAVRRSRAGAGGGAGVPRRHHAGAADDVWPRSGRAAARVHALGGHMEDQRFRQINQTLMGMSRV
jgi:predicted Ser/Thr protein kinase